MPTGRHWWPWLSFKIKSRGWGIPSAMVVSDWGAIGGWGVIGNHTAINKGPGLQSSAAESPQHLHHISRRAQSPCPLCSRWQVTFEDSLSVEADDSWPLAWVDEVAWGDHSWLVTAQAGGFRMPTRMQPTGAWVLVQGGDTHCGRMRRWSWVAHNTWTLPGG